MKMEMKIYRLPDRLYHPQKGILLPPTLLHFPARIEVLPSSRSRTHCPPRIENLAPLASTRISAYYRVNMKGKVLRQELSVHHPRATAHHRRKSRDIESFLIRKLRQPNILLNRLWAPSLLCYAVVTFVVKLTGLLCQQLKCPRYGYAQRSAL